MAKFGAISYSDSASLDAFSRLRVCEPETVFDVQSQYNRATIQMEAGNTGTGVIPTHSANTRMTALSCTAGSGTSYLQSYQYSPYQPGKSQFVAMTFVVGDGVANTTFDIGYFDANNGVILRQNGITDMRLILRTSSSGSPSDDNYVIQDNWNMDKLDGTGASGITIDFAKAQIMVIDLQFLGMGRVRVGFDINGILYYVHEFLNANNLELPYMQTATLPIGCLLTASSSGATKTSHFKCASVQSEGGELGFYGYMFATPEKTVVAASGARTVLVSIRPKTTFNGITNRQMFELLDLQMIVTGANPVFWELVCGGNYSGQSFSDVNADYSGYEYSSTAGTYTNLTGGIVMTSGYVAGAGTGANPPTVTPITLPPNLSRKYPLALDRAGAVRALGTYTLLVSGIGGTSAVRGALNYKEIR